MAKLPTVVSTAAVEQASNGNPALRTLLSQLISSNNTLATQTNTSGKQPPNQSAATVVFENPFYVVTFTDPGQSSALSPAQAAAQAAAASLGSNPTNSVIYHQVQAATSVLFDVPSNLTTFGGDTGSLQTQFVCSGLSTSDSWFFRIRTSYDGNTWNQWKIINTSGTVVNSNAVETEPINGGTFATLTLPGSQVVGFGVGNLESGQTIQTAAGVILANTLGIVGPASYNDGPAPTVGISDDSIDSLGVVTLTYDGQGTGQWDGSVNFLTFGWVANGSQALAETVLGDGGRWCIMTLAGGSRIAIGSGTCASGATIDVPSGFTLANTLGVVTPLTTNETASYLHGVAQSNMVAGVVTCTFNGNAGTATSTANWLCLAYEEALAANLVAVTGGQYLKLPIPSGDVMIGVGNTNSGDIMPLPAGGYSYPNCLAFSSPGTNDDTGGTAMHGIEVCHIDASLPTSIGTVTCLYTNGGPSWTGSANWMAICWPD